MPQTPAPFRMEREFKDNEEFYFLTLKFASEAVCDRVGRVLKLVELQVENLPQFEVKIAI